MRRRSGLANRVSVNGAHMDTAARPRTGGELAALAADVGLSADRQVLARQALSAPPRAALELIQAAGPGEWWHAQLDGMADGGVLITVAVHADGARGARAVESVRIRPL